jgi:hypothetical protein
LVLWQLERYEEAIASFDRTIQIISLTSTNHGIFEAGRYGNGNGTMKQVLVLRR